MQPRSWVQQTSEVRHDKIVKGHNNAKKFNQPFFVFIFLQTNCSELGAVCMALNQDLKLTRCVCSNGVILDHVHPKCSECKFVQCSLPLSIELSKVL